MSNPSDTDDLLENKDIFNLINLLSHYKFLIYEIIGLIGTAVLLIIIFSWLSHLIPSIAIGLIIIDLVFSAILTILRIRVKTILSLEIPIFLSYPSLYFRFTRSLFFIFLGEILTSGFESKFFLFILMAIIGSLIMYQLIISMNSDYFKKINDEITNNELKYKLTSFCIILLVLSLVMRFYNIYSISTWQEGLNALVSSYIFENQNWLVPKIIDDIDGNLKVIKAPPLLFWLQGISIAILGQTTIAITIIEGLILCLVVLSGFGIFIQENLEKDSLNETSRENNVSTFNKNTIIGIFAGLFLALSWLFALYGRTNLVGPLFSSFVILSIVCGIKAIDYSFKTELSRFRGFFILHSALLGCNLFTGGLLSLYALVPVGIYFIYIFKSKKSTISDLNENKRKEIIKTYFLWIFTVIGFIFLFILWWIIFDTRLNELNMDVWEPIGVYRLDTNFFDDIAILISPQVIITFPFFLVGLYSLFKSKSYNKAFLFLSWLAVVILMIFFNQSKLDYFYLSLLFPYYLSSAEGLYWCIFTSKSRLNFQNNTEKLLLAFPFWIILILFQIPFIFDESNLDSLLSRIIEELSLKIVILTLLFFTFVILFVRSFPELISISLICSFIILYLLGNDVNLLDEKLLVLSIILIILCLHLIRKEIPLKSLGLLFLILFSASLTNSVIIYEKNTENANYELIASYIIDKGGNKNGSVWVFGEPGARMSLQFYMKDKKPVNYGNYGNFPFNSNSSKVMEDYLNKHPELKFFVILSKSKWQYITPQSSFLESYNWLRSHFVLANRLISLNDDSSIQFYVSESIFNK
ncbi:MAG: ArnT family glycosyltransferase [Candidatus Hodarchaeales archaeon]|jgi:hypothetical protein